MGSLSLPMRTLAVSLCITYSPLLLGVEPLDKARARVQQTFTQKPGSQFAIDPAVISGPWAEVPFDKNQYTYSFAEMRQHWPRLMRGLRIAYPSPEYLRERYLRFPEVMQGLGYQHDDWQLHSLNVLEVWQAFLRGDFRKARDLGIRYGGFAQVPGIFAQIMQGIYLAKTYQEKQVLLQDALNRTALFAKTAPFLPGEKSFSADYVLFRLGFSYAAARLAEDEAVPKMLTSGYLPLVINAANEARAVDPDHPLVLALNAAFDANVIRRVGKAAGKIALGAAQGNAREQLRHSLAVMDDIAITHYEFANSMLYMDNRAATDEAIQHLQTAAALPASFSMEALDALYAKKRLAEVRALQQSGKGFRGFDRARRKYLRQSGVNLYCVTQPPFLIQQ